MRIVEQQSNTFRDYNAELAELDDLVERGPSLLPLLTPAIVLVAFAAGAFLAITIHGAGCVAPPWDGSIAGLMSSMTGCR